MKERQTRISLGEKKERTSRDSVGRVYRKNMLG